MINKYITQEHFDRAFPLHKTGRIMVEESALDSLKAMAQQLQSERDELLHQLMVARDLVFDAREAFGPCDHSVGICNCDMDKSIRESDELIDKCTSNPEVLA